MPTVTTTVTSAAVSGVVTTQTTTEATPDPTATSPASFPSGRMVVGYWRIRGLAQSIRVLCEYCEFPFENVMYAQSPCPRPVPELMCKGHPFPDMEAYTKSKKCWFDAKATVMGDYHSPNLPFLIDGEVKLTESNAILRYIGRKAAAAGGKHAAICGGTPSEVAACEFMIDKAMELRNKLVAVGYGTFFPSFNGTIEQHAGKNASEFYDTVAAAYKEGIPADNAMFEKYLGAGTYFAGGDNVTVCDFHMYELLDQQRAMFGATIYEGFPKIQTFMRAFGALPNVAAAYTKYDLPANNEMGWTTVAGIV